MRAPSMLFGVVLAGVVALLCASPDEARAQERAQEEEDPRYLELVRTAINASAEGDWEAARQLFEQAYALHPSARTLRGIGIAAVELGDHPAAVASLERALAEERRSLTEEQRQEVFRLLQRATPLVVRADLHLEPADARLLVDGSERAYTDPNGALLLSPGHHVITAIAGDARVEREVEVMSGSRMQLAIRVEGASAGPSLGLSLVEGEEIGPIAQLLFYSSAGALGATLISAIWLIERELHYTGSCSRFGAGCLNREQIQLERDAAIGLTAALGGVSLGLAVTALGIWMSGMEGRGSGGDADPGAASGIRELRLRCGLTSSSGLCAVAGRYSIL